MASIYEELLAEEQFLSQWANGSSAKICVIKMEEAANFSPFFAVLRQCVKFKGYALPEIIITDGVAIH